MESDSGKSLDFDHPAVQPVRFVNPLGNSLRGRSHQKRRSLAQVNFLHLAIPSDNNSEDDITSNSSSFSLNGIFRFNFF